MNRIHRHAFADRTTANRAAGILARLDARLRVLVDEAAAPGVYLAARGESESEWYAVHEDDAARCQRCGTQTVANTLCTVNARGLGIRCIAEGWCGCCTNEDAFECDWTSEFWSSEYYTPAHTEDTGEMVCVEQAQRDGAELYLWENGGWWTTPEEEEEPENEPDGIPCYHAGEHSETRSNWAAIPHAGALFFGIELETLAPSGGVREWGDMVRDAGMLPERDGSLDEVRGVEVIARPLPLSEVASHWGPLLWSGIKHGVKGWTCAGYGLHVSMNRSWFKSPLHVAKTALFVNAHQSLSEKVAGRPNGGHFTYYPLLSWRDLANRDGSYGGKYRAVNVTPHRVEFRIFQSNLRLPGFLRSVEYAAAVAHFCRREINLRSLRTACLEKQFTAFVRSRRAEWPNLAGFLAAKN